MSGKTRVEQEKEAAELAAQKYVRVGFQGAPSSFRQVMRYRMTPNNTNSLFNCDIEFLQDSETVRPLRLPLPPPLSFSAPARAHLRPPPPTPVPPPHKHTQPPTPF